MEKSAKELIESGLSNEQVSDLIEESYEDSNEDNHEEIEEEHGPDADPDDYWTEDHRFDMAAEAAFANTIKKFKIRFTDLRDILDGCIASFNVKDTYEERLVRLANTVSDKKQSNGADKEEFTLTKSRAVSNIFRRDEFYKYQSYLKVSDDDLLNEELEFDEDSY